MPLLDLHHISRRYGAVQALRDVTLTLEPGTVGLVGNNGAGKSTLLKILLGLLAPDSGWGTILGYDVRHSRGELRGRVGYMPETAATVPLLRGVEFVALSGDLYGMPHRDARRRAHELLDYVGLGELRYRRLEEYSTGNLQRLKLAAALVHDPELLLLDEPTNGLDPAGRAAMLQLLHDLLRETGKSLILCTHLLGDVERLCEQVVVLHQGTVVRAGNLRLLRSAARNRFELGWSGATEPFRTDLVTAGAQLLDARRNGDCRALISVPVDWSTTTLFRLAEANGVTITQLQRDEENLEQLFLRVTEQGSGAAEGNAPLADRG